MRTYKPQWLSSPINLPERQVGKMQIRHRIMQAGERVNIIGARQAIMCGRRPVFAELVEQLTVHELVETDRGVWMTDLPEELNQIAEMVHTVRPRGRVLIGGLGLGISAAVVSALSSVSVVHVVEHSQDVVDLCRASGYGVIVADIQQYLETTAEHYDCFLLDTWTGTNESTWWEEVMPQRRVIRSRWGIKPVIYAWAEDIMIGQLMRTLQITEPHWYYKHLPLPMSRLKAQRFISGVGLPWWEKQYGLAVDKAFAREREREEALDI